MKDWNEIRAELIRKDCMHLDHLPRDERMKIAAAYWDTYQSWQKIEPISEADGIDSLLEVIQLNLAAGEDCDESLIGRLIVRVITAYLIKGAERSLTEDLPGDPELGIDRYLSDRERARDMAAALKEIA